MLFPATTPFPTIRLDAAFRVCTAGMLPVADPDFDTTTMLVAFAIAKERVVIRPETLVTEAVPEAVSVGPVAMLVTAGELMLEGALAAVEDAGTDDEGGASVGTDAASLAVLTGFGVEDAEDGVGRARNRGEYVSVPV
ncbi:hypothetical protein LOZ58_003805 [Ophidiomyces ophidiicola]|nr:hypothetical protein LOZ65_000624 [Ophidiomyces ophidiicola]KAI1941975.1 hypothetical protein LOZ66_001456 [Ophidiomyces ophidiicola]KAI1960732.1 hypothetical protein LOZ58_003805 [Ophidiomyces ophidiicola]